MSTSCVQNTATRKLRHVCMARGVASKATAEVSGPRDVGLRALVRLVLAEFNDPARLVRLGPVRFRALAAHRGIRVPQPGPRAALNNEHGRTAHEPPAFFVLAAPWVHHGS